MEISKAARNVLMEKKHGEGATMASLAREFDLSPERVRQILATLQRNRRTIAWHLEAPLRRVTKAVSAEPPR